MARKTKESIGHVKQLNSNDKFWLGMFLIPNLSMYFLFILIPSAVGVLLSFCEWDLLNPVKWVGFENYRRIPTDEMFIPSLIVSVKFLMLGVVPTIFMGFLVAALINWKARGIAAIRVLFFLPLVLSTAVAGIVWSAILQPETGLMNAMLSLIGIPGPMWLTDFTWALPGMTIIIIWLSLPLVIILYLAGMQRISPEILEAAALDGANVWTRVWQVIFPCVASTTALVIVLEILAFLGSPLEVALIMTQGGPLDATTSLGYYAYKVAFDQFEIGYSAAIIMVQFLIFLIIALIAIAIRKRFKVVSK